MSRYTKQKIALAPNNMSAWNYLRGVLGHAHVPYPTLISFVEPYTSASPPSNDDDVVDLENPLPSKGAQLPCPAAIEFLADAYEAEGAGGLSKSVEVRLRGVSIHRSYSNRLVFDSFGSLLRMNTTRFGRSKSMLSVHLAS